MFQTCTTSTTRRARNKLNERRHTLMEEIIKSDPLYKPPADYKPRK